MIHKVINFLVMLILLTATACQFRINDGENKLMLLPATYNLENLNSKYDDYNLTAPPNYDQGLSVVYSTKYNEHNEERGFDVYEGSIVFEINRYGNGNNSYGNCSLKTSRDNAITYLNTIYNERGPIWISDYYRDFDTFKDDSSHFYFVSTDRPTSNIDSVNDYNILGFYLDENRKCQQVNFAGNTEKYNELYPCIDYARQTIYFCNDKDGTYNIYSWTYNTDDKRCKIWGNSMGQLFTELNIVFSAWGNFGATKHRNREGEGKQKGNRFLCPLCIQSPCNIRLYKII
jgi:hypothetical protein